MTKNTLADLKRRARERGDIARARELETYRLGNRSQSFDAAAEQLTYLYRLLGGSWPKAVAGYNVGATSILNWFDGEEGEDSEKGKIKDPMYFAATKRDKNNELIQTNKWTEEVPAYLRHVLRGAAEDPETPNMYDYQPPEQYRARKAIPPRQQAAPAKRP